MHRPLGCEVERWRASANEALHDAEILAAPQLSAVLSEQDDRISGIPGRVKLVEEFIKYAQKQKGVVFMRKDEIAKWALSAPNVPHEA